MSQFLFAVIIIGHASKLHFLAMHVLVQHIGSSRKRGSLTMVSRCVAVHALVINYVRPSFVLRQD